MHRDDRDLPFLFLFLRAWVRGEKQHDRRGTSMFARRESDTVRSRLGEQRAKDKAEEKRRKAKAKTDSIARRKQKEKSGTNQGPSKLASNEQRVSNETTDLVEQNPRLSLVSVPSFPFL